MEINFNSSLEAWEGINEMFLQGKAPYFNGGFYLYNVTLNIENPKINFNAPLGRYFNYSRAKWTQLLGNYLNKSLLNSLKKEIKSKGDNKTYNIEYSFENNHAHGKNCLLSAVFSFRLDTKKPHITFFLRASEITKRLLVDLIFFQRIGEYVYGKSPFTISVHIVQVFQDPTVLLMYHAHKSILKYLSKNKTLSGKKMLDTYSKFMESKPSDIKYKVHLRAFKVLRPDLYEYPNFTLEDCTL